MVLCCACNEKPIGLACIVDGCCVHCGLYEAEVGMTPHGSHLAVISLAVIVTWLLKLHGLEDWSLTPRTAGSEHACCRCWDGEVLWL